MIEGKLVCDFASLEHTRLVPIGDVMPGESPHLCRRFYSTSALLELLVSGNVPPSDEHCAPSEQSEFVFGLQREQRAFCSDGCLAFESHARYSGSLFSTVAYWFAYACFCHLSWERHRSIKTDIVIYYISPFSLKLLNSTFRPHLILSIYRMLPWTNFELNILNIWLHNQ